MAWRGHCRGLGRVALARATAVVEVTRALLWLMLRGAGGAASVDEAGPAGLYRGLLVAGAVSVD